MTWPGCCGQKGLPYDLALLTLRGWFAGVQQPPASSAPFPFADAERALLDAFDKPLDSLVAAHDGETSTPDPALVSPSRASPVADRAALRGLAGEAVTLLEPSTEADWIGVNAALLAGLGTWLGPDPHLQIASTRHPLLIWPLLCGATSTGRKGEAAAGARRVLHEAEPLMATHIVSGLSTGEGLIHRVRDGRGDRDEGVDDKRLLVEEQEFSSVMARARREGSTLAQVLRDLWDGRTVQTLTRADPMKATRPHVGLVAQVTPREFRMRLAEADLAGGTYNRLLPIYVERTKKLPVPPDLDQHGLSHLGKRLHKALHAARGVGRVTLHADVLGLWADLYDEFTDDEDGRARGVHPPRCAVLPASGGPTRGARRSGADQPRRPERRRRADPLLHRDRPLRAAQRVRRPPAGPDSTCR